MNKIDEIQISTAPHSATNLWSNIVAYRRNITDTWNNFIATNLNAEQLKGVLKVKEKENKKMKVVTVKFLGSAREYEYWTNLDLKVGAKYKATADGTYTYDTPVIVVRYAQKPSFNGKLRTLTKMELVDKEKNPTKTRLKKLVFNKKKKTTAALWTDGTVTKVKLMNGEEWNEEYAFAACILKKFFGDRGYTKKDFRKMLAAAERDYGAEDENLKKNFDSPSHLEEDIGRRVNF